MLCEKCQKIRPPYHHERRDRCLILHHACIDDLIRSANLGCELCQRFQPYVEQQRSQKFKAATISSDGIQQGNGHWNSDPFKRLPQWHKLSNGFTYFSYGDYGKHYQLIGTNMSDKQLALKREEVEKESPVPKVTSHDRINVDLSDHEIFSWLFAMADISTGPEQIWIECKDSGSGYGWFWRSKPPCATFKISLGSTTIADGYNYCIEGKNFSVQSLVANFPGLWKWPVVNLNLNNARYGYPKFEFCTPAGTVAFETWPSITARPIQEHAGETLDMIRGWLSDCAANHERCGGDGGLPRRVIDIEQMSIRESYELHATEPYAILSHCWGHDLPESAVLCSRTMARMRHEVRWDDLPKTFQDAITVTRALEIRYLWIDALCIIQDSVDDWATEAARMAEYYSGSRICIAAASSSDATHGFLHPRPAEYLATELPTGVAVRTAASEILSVLRFCWFHTWRSELTDLPLAQRSWAFQERLFSRRIVYFVSEQLIWQCLTRIVGEDGQVGEEMKEHFEKGSEKERNGIDLVLKEPLREITAANENEHGRDTELQLRKPVRGHTGVKYGLDEALYDIGWYDLLQEYTKRKVTYATDLLPAVSALASEVQKLSNAAYLAGLWTMDDDIPIRSLLWYATSPHQRANNGSPTWSWSSVLGAIEHPALDMLKLDHPGMISEHVPVDEGWGGKTRTTFKIGEKQPRNISTTQLALRYEHRNSTLRILKTDVSYATISKFGQVRKATIEIEGLVHEYRGMEMYDFAAERIDSHKDYEMKESWDACSTRPSESRLCLLLFMAEFRDNIDGSMKPEIPAKDCRVFLILGQNVDDPHRFERMGLVKLTSKHRHGSLSGCRCAYVEENGWSRQILVLE